jgi:hypothetical protein
MATVSKERLISSDDHVDISHDSVKKHLAARCGQAVPLPTPGIRD